LIPYKGAWEKALFSLHKIIFLLRIIIQK
jgi:hypothetical protein